MALPLPSRSPPLTMTRNAYSRVTLGPCKLSTPSATTPRYKAYRNSLVSERHDGKKRATRTCDAATPGLHAIGTIVTGIIDRQLGRMTSPHVRRRHQQVEPPHCDRADGRPAPSPRQPFILLDELPVLRRTGRWAHRCRPTTSIGRRRGVRAGSFIHPIIHLCIPTTYRTPPAYATDILQQ